MNCRNCGHDESAAAGPYIGNHVIFHHMSLARCELVFAQPQAPIKRG